MAPDVEQIHANCFSKMVVTYHVYTAAITTIGTMIYTARFDHLELLVCDTADCLIGFSNDIILTDCAHQVFSFHTLRYSSR